MKIYMHVIDLLQTIPRVILVQIHSYMALQYEKNLPLELQPMAAAAVSSLIS